MESNFRFTAARSGDNSFAFTPHFIEELPRLHHSADDAAYMDWLNKILQNKGGIGVDDVPTNTAWRAMDEC